MEEVIFAVAYMNIDQCKALMEKELKWRSDVKSIIFHLCLFYMNGGKKILLIGNNVYGSFKAPAK